MYQYKTWNAAMPTTAPPATVATGTTTKTMLQIAPPSTIHGLTVIAWGYSLNAAPASGGQIELIETDVAATVTPHVAAGIIKLDGNMEASKVTLGAAATGYTASAEGVAAATRLFDHHTLSSTADQLKYAYQFMPKEAPIINAGKFLRVRATMGTSVNMTCWIVWDE